MEEIELQATPAGFSILQAWNFVKDHGNSTKKRWENAPLDGLSAGWAKIVIDKDRGMVITELIHFGCLSEH